MPKISQDWIHKGSTSDKSKDKEKNVKAADVFIRPQVGESVRGRIVGGHASFVAHWPRIDNGEKDENGDIVWKNSTFPDAEERYHKPTRICCDDTPAKKRFEDIEGYLKNTKCPWCKLKFQGYHGSVRHAFNIIVRPENACKVLEVPPTAMGALSKICEKCSNLMPQGNPGNINGKVFEFVFARPQKTQWTVERYPNLELDDPNIENYLVGLTEADKKALAFINPEAETEEDLLKEHDLDRWYKKDYLSAEWQRKLMDQLGLKPGEYLELSPYDIAQGNDNVVEKFESEVETMEKNDENVADAIQAEDEWGSLDSAEEASAQETTPENESATQEDEDSPLW